RGPGLTIDDPRFIGRITREEAFTIITLQPQAEPVSYIGNSKVTIEWIETGNLRIRCQRDGATGAVISLRIHPRDVRISAEAFPNTRKERELLTVTDFETPDPPRAAIV